MLAYTGCGLRRKGTPRSGTHVQPYLDYFKIDKSTYTDTDNNLEFSQMLDLHISCANSSSSRVDRVLVVGVPRVGYIITYGTWLMPMVMVDGVSFRRFARYFDPVV